MDAALVILHLLLSFKSLFAFNSRAFEFVLVMNGYIMLVNFFWRQKHRKSNFRGLYHSLDTAFVSEMRAAESWSIGLIRGGSGGWTIRFWVSEAHLEDFLGKNLGPISSLIVVESARSGGKVKYFSLFIVNRSVFGQKFVAYKLCVLSLVVHSWEI